MVQAAALLAASSLGASAAEKAVPSATPKIPLKPFQQTVQAKTNQSVAGTWKGTFVLSRQGGGKEEVTYLVEVAADMSTLSVSAVPPLSSSPDGFLNPITATPAQADWDGEVLKAEMRESTQNGETKVAAVKKFTLCPGNDARHAAFTYQVTVKSTKPKAVETNILKGDGTLTRSR